MNWFVWSIALMTFFSNANGEEERRNLRSRNTRDNSRRELYYSLSRSKLVRNDGWRNEHFGNSTAMSDDFLVVGAPKGNGNDWFTGVVYVYQNISNVWTKHSTLIADDGERDDEFGNSVGISGSNLIVGAPKDKSAYIFEYDEDSNKWLQTEKLTVTTDHDYFGMSVAISGDTAVVGAPSENVKYQNSKREKDNDVVYIFKKNADGQWVKAKELKSNGGKTDDMFGASVSISGDYVVVGAPEDNNIRGENSGVTYVFDGANNWARQTIFPNDGLANDSFGYSVSIAGSVIVVGSYDVHNVGGSGYAYVFEPDQSGAWTQSTKLSPNDGISVSFGYSVSTSDRMIVVGAPAIGKAYTFLKSEAWARHALLDGYSVNDEFGASVAMAPNENTNTVVVGVPLDGDSDKGAVWVHEINGL